MSLGQALRVHSLIPLPFCSVCFMIGIKNVTAQVLVLAVS